MSHATKNAIIKALDALPVGVEGYLHAIIGPNRSIQLETNLITQKELSAARESLAKKAKELPLPPVKKPEVLNVVTPTTEPAVN
ncbi:hypothetical protein [Dyadobacter psychrotolerans]|uniref:Uncharacterized protein n=1 Tax=Dyadobacter psychrotolerans TaxID=2541721 RepID=A0A4R5DLZ0_9BACT|nr:hypothetical protein [Dyadobacter psychrotolerans]TDE15282.1 hypothetical protein E0F88_12220 [Dyadobacter psychrotolerans]